MSTTPPKPWGSEPMAWLDKDAQYAPGLTRREYVEIVILAALADSTDAPANVPSDWVAEDIVLDRAQRLAEGFCRRMEARSK